MGHLKRPLASDAIHLCIDMQRLFSSGGPWETPWLAAVLPEVLPLIEALPERTIFARFLPPFVPEESPGQWREYYRTWRDITLDRLDPAFLELIEPLNGFIPPAEVFDRRQYSTFANGRLHYRLQQRKTTTLVITGSETDVCVLSSVLSAVDLGYRVVVARDGVCSSADSGHDDLLELFTRRFSQQIEVADISEILSAWQK